MDPTFSGLPNFINNAFSTNSNQYPDLLNEYNKFNVPSPDLSFPGPDLGHTDFPPPATVGPAAESFALSSEDGEFSETVLKYISQILMEENIEDKPCLFYDPLGLQVTEKSFYDALGQDILFLQAVAAVGIMVLVGVLFQKLLFLVTMMFSDPIWLRTFLVVVNLCCCNLGEG